MNSDAQDSELVRDSLRGERKAFETIVESYQKPIFNVALKILHRVDDAEDITQSVFIKAYENLSKFNTKYRLFSWLYRIAINESLNLQKLQRRNVSLDVTLVSSEPTPEELCQDNQANQAVHEAVDKLKADYQVVIILKHFQGLSYEQISEILEVPEKTVKSRLYDARQLLRDILIRRP